MSVDLTPQQLKLAWYLLSLFKIGDKRASEVVTKGQFDIFCAILFKLNPRVACMSPTGYGKTEFVSMGVVACTTVMNEEFIIASVKYGTSDLIMKMAISHIFDNPLFSSQLEFDNNEKFERLKRERKADKVTFLGGGSLKVISLYGTDTDVGTAIGEHKPNVVLDESPLLHAVQYLQLKKILEGTGDYNKTFLMELGNAVNRNHFMQNILFNDDYLKLNIGLEQAIAEGRLDRRSVEENRGLPFFESFYECKFPDEEGVDSKGYRTLITESTILSAFTNEVFKQPEQLPPPAPPVKPIELILGADIGGGGDSNVYVLRSPTMAWVESSNRSTDTMTNVSEIERIMRDYNVKAENVFIDDTGIGRGVTDRLKELGHSVNGVAVGVSAEDPTRYSNLKAECYWKCKQWLENSGTLQQVDKWIQLNWVRYKINTDKVLAIEPKADQKKRTGKSPDFADALMLTFAQAKQPRATFL